MIKLFLGLVALTIPSSLLYLNVNHPEAKGRLLFTCFVAVIAVTRVWELYFSSKEKEPLRLQGDWTLIVTNFTYLLTGLFVIFEFFYSPLQKNPLISALGGFIFVCAGLLRFWAIKSLGTQWAVHAVGPSKIARDQLRLVRSGPYRYIRHPIYTGVMLEFIAMSLIANAYFSLIFIALISIPLQIVRAAQEEKTSHERFGHVFEEYRKEVPFLFPRFCALRGCDALL